MSNYNLIAYIFRQWRFYFQKHRMLSINLLFYKSHDNCLPYISYNICYRCKTSGEKDSYSWYWFHVSFNIFKVTKVRSIYIRVICTECLYRRYNDFEAKKCHKSGLGLLTGISFFNVISAWCFTFVICTDLSRQIHYEVNIKWNEMASFMASFLIF